ncbi:kumamolisin [Mycolicibacterium sp. BK556]|uniref:S53 family peptidase n=1 Tax=unclassified Mycolicibacterium TaxID=2636767 RepID=UPI00160DE692|nr:MULTISPECIES: S53 family peptidase [unclassified Mycolicibacterium]MBB3603099.1 kumamolisin [Mycolicibacterium sp. BK556]MBB3633294.1 kumamolisin [Mycolicibacterium sp. BK607]
MTRTVLALLSVGVLALAGCGARPHADSIAPQAITGPYQLLLAASDNLGDSQVQAVQLTAELQGTQTPDRLQRWAAANGLSVRWEQGARWAVLQGPPASVASAFGVAVHDYRSPLGERFYASPEQPAVPAALRDSVSALGRILSYTPYHSSSPSIRPLPSDVPDHSLPPDALRTIYNVRPLASAGYTGKGTTIVVFAFDGFDQADLDMYAQTYGLPMFTPEVVGGMPEQRNNEASMDLQVAHALAPDARKVLVNARPTVEGGGTYVKIADMMQEVAKRFPGAVWSLSIGWGCDRMATAADLTPIREAVTDAVSRGTTVFNASGDLAGLECKRGHDWSAPPGPADVGLDAVASLPEVTTVGGTTLSTDEHYQWLAENGWSDGPLTQGSGGGISALFDRPEWQTAAPTTALRRLTPDVSAVADTTTGAVIVLRQQLVVGGGTSQAAPLWAGIAAVMNQFLRDNGGRALGDLNPTLYRVAAGATRPAFHDIVLGTNAVAVAGPGYDMVTGLGTPNVDNLARDILDIQRGMA